MSGTSGGKHTLKSWPYSKCCFHSRCQRRQWSLCLLYMILSHHKKQYCFSIFYWLSSVSHGQSWHCSKGGIGLTSMLFYSVVMSTEEPWCVSKPVSKQNFLFCLCMKVTGVYYLAPCESWLKCGPQHTAGCAAPLVQALTAKVTWCLLLIGSFANAKWDVLACLLWLAMWISPTISFFLFALQSYAGICAEHVCSHQQMNLMIFWGIKMW